MNIAEVFIRRPIMTTLVMASILLAGVMGYFMLPVSDLPNVDFPTIEVTAGLPGANPDTMASTVATPLEKEFSTIAGLDSMTSSSSLGYTTITLQFTLNRNIDAAAADVQSAISRASKQLPPDMPTPPSYRKVNPADDPFLFMAMVSPDQPMSALDELGQTMIAQRISMVDGVAQVQVLGPQKYAVRVQVDPYALAARKIGIDEVADRIAQSNVNLPLGMLNGPHQNSTIQANGQLMEARSYLPLIVAYRDGQPVRLREVGTAIDSVENNKTAAWCIRNGMRDRAIILGVQRQPGSNTVEVAHAVKALLPEFREKLPASVSLVLMRDQSIWIEESAKDVQFTLLLTLGLVVMVIFLFLRNLSATIIPSLVLPMSIIGTFAVMYLLNYSIDNLSLMALTLSVGFVVDDAIVMLENIVRHMEMGKSRMQAALDGSAEIGFTIVSMTISLAAVFIPFLLMGGLLGRLFREFSVVIGVAVMVSGFVAMTLTPMLSSRFLKNQHKMSHGLFYRATEACFVGLQKAYGWSLQITLRHRRLTMLFSLGILVASYFLFEAVPKGFIPSEDREIIRITVEAAQDSSFDSMVAHQMTLADIIQNHPDVDRAFCSVQSGNSGRLTPILKPRSQRTKSADELIEELRPRLNSVPGIRASLNNPLPITFGSRFSKTLYQWTLQSYVATELYQYAGEMEQKLREMGDFTDVSSDMKLRNPQLNVQIDRDRASMLGVTPAQIEEALSCCYSTRQISTIYAPKDQYRVILEVEPRFQTDRSMLSMVYIRSSGGDLVPLQAVAHFSEDVGPLVVNHSGQLPSVTIFFNLKPGVSLGQAIEQIDDLTRGSMPSGMTSTFQGTAQVFQSSLKSMTWLLVLAVVVIYVVLGILYESFYHPITILSALPFAGFGALLTLLVFNAELSIYAFVGIIMLVGLVKKNGIMMVDFALEAQRKEGKNSAEAIFEACMVRFRPITMTTMAALMGALPIAMGYGAGAESRRPLGLAVVGGLLFSQSLTLYVTPVFYVYMEKFANFFRKKPAAPEANSAGE